MSFYESVIIARQDLAAPQVESLAEELAQIIVAQGGQVTKREFWGLRNIAYRMKKNRKGHYVLFNIDGPSAAVKEFERMMSISEDVLRFLTVRVEALEEGPSAVVQSKNQRDERPRREGGFGGGRDGGFGGGFGGGRDGGGFGGGRGPRVTEGAEA